MYLSIPCINCRPADGPTSSWFRRPRLVSITCTADVFPIPHLIRHGYVGNRKRAMVMVSGGRMTSSDTCLTTGTPRQRYIVGIVIPMQRILFQSRNNIKETDNATKDTSVGLHARYFHNGNPPCCLPCSVVLRITRSELRVTAALRARAMVHSGSSVHHLAHSSTPATTTVIETGMARLAVRMANRATHIGFPIGLARVSLRRCIRNTPGKR